MLSATRFVINVGFRFISLQYLIGKGFKFGGVELGAGGLGNFSLGAIGGYQHYFKEDLQFYTFRHGIRGYASVNWTQYDYNIWYIKDNYNALYVRAGADWTLEFNPKSDLVWGCLLGYL